MTREERDKLVGPVIDALEGAAFQICLLGTRETVRPDPCGSLVTAYTLDADVSDEELKQSLIGATTLTKNAVELLEKLVK